MAGEQRSPPAAPQGGAGSSRTHNSKSDFIKMSVTVPPEMFEALQAISMQRRREKQPHTMSNLVREAVARWLP